MKKAGTDNVQFLLFLEFRSKYVKNYNFKTGNLWGFAEKWLIFPNACAIIKTIRWKNMGDETKKMSLSASELWK